MKGKDWAAAFFSEGYSCSQSVLAAFARRYGLDEKTALRLASGFGGGLARRGETCGAASGACMVLGLAYGHTQADDTAGKERTYQAIQEYTRLFEQKLGSLACRELIGFDMSTPEGLKAARDSGVFSSRCPEIVAAGSHILEELLGSEG